MLFKGTSFTRDNWKRAGMLRIPTNFWHKGSMGCQSRHLHSNDVVNQLVEMLHFACFISEL